jgi:hypothetical protein
MTKPMLSAESYPPLKKSKDGAPTVLAWEAKTQKPGPPARPYFDDSSAS